MPVSHTPPTKKLAPVGKCIYCGADGKTTKLTDEHFLPYSLGGYHVLPEASCEQCGKVTSYLDGFLANKVYRSYRHVNQMQTRRPKERPKTLDLRIQTEHQEIDTEIDIEEHPAPFTTTAFDAPGIFRGLKPGDPFGPVVYHIFQRDLQETAVPKIARVHGGAQISAALSKYSPYTFARGLAKIAHGAAVATVGLNNFKPFLPPLILKEGESNTLPYYVGGKLDLEPKTTERSRATMRRCHFNGEYYLVADLRLLGNAGCPTYHIVTGTVSPDLKPSEPIT
jgi:hypothetical protein